MNVGHLFMFFLLLQSSSASFDYYMITETWDPTFCKGQTCKAKFTLHGLWPQNNTGPQPSKCPTIYKLNIKEFETSLQNDLKSYWPSLTGNNKGFWTHEWTDHGTCSMLPPSDYFKLAITLHKDNLIAVILRNNGITPDATMERTPTEIVNILKMHTKGKEPQLMCDTSKKLLAEVRICFEKSNTSNYRDCPMQTNCGKTILYPPVKF